MNSDNYEKTGTYYMGREVITFHWKDAFGCSVNKPAEKMTLCNGYVNQMALRPKKPGCDNPTPYWAVMDAMCEKTDFSKEEIVAMAVNVLKLTGYKPPSKGLKEIDAEVSLKKACEIAWYVLKTHHRHPMKKNLGLAYMVDNVGGGRYHLRFRRDDEVIGREDLDIIAGEKPLKVVVLRR